MDYGTSRRRNGQSECNHHLHAHNLGFAGPNGATCSPDVAWVQRARLAVLTAEQKEKFLPLCPDFVIELRSASDDLGSGQEKMREYLDNGT